MEDVMSENTATLTPYQAAKRVNAALKEAGLEVEVPPQMMYGYTTARINKGKKPLIETKKVAGQVRVTESGLAKWIGAYVSKKVAENQAADTEDAENSDSEVETDNEQVREDAAVEA